MPFFLEVQQDSSLAASNIAGNSKGTGDYFWYNYEELKNSLVLLSFLIKA